MVAAEPAWKRGIGMACALGAFRLMALPSSNRRHLLQE
jgi:hypothetical protein